MFYRHNLHNFKLTESLLKISCKIPFLYRNNTLNKKKEKKKNCILCHFCVINKIFQISTQKLKKYFIYLFIYIIFCYSKIPLSTFYNKRK